MSITTDYTAAHRAFRRVGREHGLHPTAIRAALAIDEHRTTSPGWSYEAKLLDDHGHWIEVRLTRRDGDA